MMKRGLLFSGCLVALLLQLAGCDSKGGQVAILDIEPKLGATAGDQYVKILGKNFRQDIGYTVYFGTKKSAQVTIVDPETLLATTPTGVKAGQVDVLIRADDGNAFRIPQVFKFEDMGGAVDPAGAGKKQDRGSLAY